MTVLLSPVGGAAAQFFDNNGTPLTGGKLYSYVAGTTTPQATYTSASGATAHTNPVILDSGGRVPGGEIWLTDGLQYKFVLKTSTDVLIGTYDNLVGVNSNFVNFLTETEVQTATAGQTVFTLTTMQYQPSTNNLTVYVDGVNQIDGATYSYVETDATTVTFTAGLHVGALVKFTTAQTLSTGVTDSSLVTYIPPFTNSVETTVELKLAQTVSVKDFGAVGNGIANDAAAVQTAVDYCLLNEVSLYVPSGAYRLASQIDVDLNSVLVAGRGLNIYGEGWGSKFIIDHTGQGFYVNCIPSLNVFQGEFRDLYFTTGSTTPARIIHIDGACNTLVRDCIFQNATVGVGCVVNDNAYGLTLQNCNFHNITGTGAFYAQTSSLSTYSFVNAIIDCDFSMLTKGVEVQGCSALFAANTVFQECDIGFRADPVFTQTTAFNITFDTCWFERNTTWDIELNSDANYWCEASIRNCQFAGFPPTFQANIQLAQKSKVTIEGSPAGNQVIVTGANDAAAVLIRATNFVQSGVYAWTSIDPYGNVLAKTYKSLSGVYANPASGATVTLTTLPNVTSGTWLTTAELDGSGDPAQYHCVGVLSSQATTAIYTPIKTATGLTVSASGLNLQGNQVSGGAYSITWSLTRLA